MASGKWARYVLELQASPGVWATPLVREVPHRVKYAQRRLKVLGAEAVVEYHGLESATLRARWPESG